MIVIIIIKIFYNNSKILYAVDIQHHYDVSFIIYKYASSFGIDAFCMEQQIGRPRNTDKLQLLCLDPKALFYSNTYISFEENKLRQQKFIQTRTNLHHELCKKYSVIDEMGIVDLDWEGKTKFNLNSIMTPKKIKLSFIFWSASKFFTILKDD